MPFAILKKNISIFRSSLIAENQKHLAQASQQRIMAALTLGIVVLALGYFAAINSLSTKGFALKGLEVRKAELLQQQKDLQVQLAEARSTETIMKKIETLEMIPVSRVSYIKIGSSDVALAK